MDSLIYQALDKANVGMMIVDRDMKIVYWNHWLERLTGRKRKEVQGSGLKEVCPRFKLGMYSDILQKVLYHGQSRFCSSTLHKAFVLPEDVYDEDSIKQNMHVEPLYEGDSCYALIQISDMTSTHNRVYKLKNFIKELENEYNETKSSVEANRQLALRDPLTGLPNRLFFNDRLAWAISYAQRNGDKVAVMFLDLDGFKGVNDTLGHDAGDQVLEIAAERLKRCVRSVDTIARLGGDEFSAVLIQIKNDKDASIVAEKFIRAMEDPVEIAENQFVKLSVSVGISLYPKDGQEPSDLLKKADQAMYQVKAGGKNAYRSYSD